MEEEKKIRKLPILKMVLTDKGIEYVAVVDDPAIDELWIAMGKHKEMNLKFEVANNEKRIVASPLLIADQLIYRKNEKTGDEYYVYFDAQTIEATAMKFAKDLRHDSVNKMHDAKKKVDGMYMYQSFIINRELGINPPLSHKDLPDGSWFAFYKVEDDALWQEIKDGKFKGLSIEGRFSAMDTGVSAEEVAAIAHLFA